MLDDLILKESMTDTHVEQYQFLVDDKKIHLVVVLPFI